MTTIVASTEHGCMAADTRVNDSSVTFPSTKIYRVGDAILGMAGQSTMCNSFLNWYRTGADPNKIPPPPAECSFAGLVLTEEGLYFYEEDFIALPINRTFHAIGSGSQAALAAMMCGKTPRRAIEIACRIDPYSGAPVEVLSVS